ncbi:MAG: K(+)-transporting ATPase subunit F [Bradyrhizobium sp.]
MLGYLVYALIRPERF